MAASLSTPGVVALLTAWGPQLQSLHQTAVDQHGSSQQPHGKQPQGQQPLAQSQQQAPELSLSAFLELLQENGVIPQLLEPCDVQEVLRQLLTTQANQVRVGWPVHQQVAAVCRGSNHTPVGLALINTCACAFMLFAGPVRCAVRRTLCSRA